MTNFDLINSIFDDIFYPVRRDKTLYFEPITNQFPYTDIYYEKDENLVFEMALAGYKKDNLEIELNGNILVITGKHEEISEGRSYKINGVKKSSFEKKYSLPDYYDGEPEVTFIDGILKLVFIKDEDKKKKLITIK